MDIDKMEGWSNFDLFRLVLEKFGIEVKDENDIATAWRVVEKLEQHPNEILFKLVRKGSRRLHWAATFRECLGRQRYFYAQADTAPLAICRAALKALEK